MSVAHLKHQYELKTLAQDEEEQENTKCFPATLWRGVTIVPNDGRTALARK